LSGISRNSRVYKIELSYDRSLDQRLVLGKSLLSYTAINESAKTSPLFSVEGESGLIIKGTATIPQLLRSSQIPDDPATFWNLNSEEGTGLSIDNEDVTPSNQPCVEWKDEQDHSKGVRFRITYHDTILPGRAKHVSLKTKCFYCVNDYVVRRIGSYARDLSVFVSKPADIEIYVAWFLTARGKETEIVVHPADSTETSYYQRVEGILVPGNGFVLMWWRRRRQG
ncbi:hypothetical protein GTO27_08465, partial [Candidatus Bathyarchaeota archaeon]|nr:hypothetical protein [Candidatus Bathyarchaeota archaeon]